MGRFLRPDLLVSYTSPAVLFSALFLLALFRKLRVPAGLPARTVGFLAPLAFGVYLIHTHPLVWAFFLRDRFASYAQLPPLLCAGAALLTAGGIFLACTALEFAAIGSSGCCCPRCRPGCSAGAAGRARCPALPAE